MFHSIDGNYDMGLASFDIAVDMAANASYSSDISYPYEAASLHVIMDGAGMDPILHAPKPLLANERTPTKAVFGEELGVDNYAAI